MISITSPKRAREIMGDVFGVEEAIKHFNVEPTREQIMATTEIPWSEKVLCGCKDTHILIVVFPISIFKIRDRVGSELLHDHLVGSFRYDREETFTQEQGEVSWRLVRKTPAPHSTFKYWERQNQDLDKEELVPTAQVMIYTIIGHYLAAGERLFGDVYVNTSSEISAGRIYVGRFSNSLNVCVGCDYAGDLGVASARR